MGERGDRDAFHRPMEDLEDAFVSYVAQLCRVYHVLLLLMLTLEHLEDNFTFTLLFSVETALNQKQ